MIRLLYLMWSFAACPFDPGAPSPLCFLHFCHEAGQAGGYEIPKFFSLRWTYSPQHPQESRLKSPALWDKLTFGPRCLSHHTARWKTLSRQLSLLRNMKAELKCWNMLKSQNVVSSTDLFRIDKSLCELDTDAPVGCSLQCGKKPF